MLSGSADCSLNFQLRLQVRAVTAHACRFSVFLVEYMVMLSYIWTFDFTRGRDHRSLFYDMPHCMNGELCMAMVKDVICQVKRFLVSLLNQSINQSINQSTNQSINQSLNHSLTHSLTHSLNHSITHSLTHSLTHLEPIHPSIH